MLAIDDADELSKSGYSTWYVVIIAPLLSKQIDGEIMKDQGVMYLSWLSGSLAIFLKSKKGIFIICFSIPTAAKAGQKES
jgi:hypothetical protein